MKSKPTRLTLSGLLFLALLSPLSLTSCAAQNGKKAYVKECVLPAEQSSTLAAQWRVTPVPIAFKAGQFSVEEMAAITGAADVWNDFFQSVQGYKIFDYGEAAAPNQSNVNKPTIACSESILSGNSFSGQVVIYKDGRWPYTNKDAIAITNLCKSPSKPFSRLYGAYMEVNYENFFAVGKVPDLKSIFVHELGHLIGLDHSCSTKTVTGFPNCSDGAVAPDIIEAVMFPVILFDGQGRGEVRASVNANDQGRANCLYTPPAAP
ncbi:MAG: matrixin family metalloprotease [Methylotenera sp.]|nr:matrixin family metalloprotease [Oligoflexia bacterium]